jgi:hypothetical protein
MWDSNHQQTQELAAAREKKCRWKKKIVKVIKIKSLQSLKLPTL